MKIFKLLVVIDVKLRDSSINFYVEELLFYTHEVPTEKVDVVGLLPYT